MTVLWSLWSSFIFHFFNECLSDPPGDCWFYLSHSDGTNLESNAGYMGSIYLKIKEALGELFCFFTSFFFFSLQRPDWDLQPCVWVWVCVRVCFWCVLAPKPPKNFWCVFMLLTTNVENIFSPFTFLLFLFFFFLKEMKCLMHAFGLVSVEVKVHYWSSCPSV